MSSSRFRPINTACIHTQSCTPSHTSTEITQHYNQIPEHSMIEIIVKPCYRLRIKNKVKIYTTHKEVALLLLQVGRGFQEPQNFLHEICNIHRKIMHRTPNLLGWSGCWVNLHKIYFCWGLH